MEGLSVERTLGLIANVNVGNDTSVKRNLELQYLSQDSMHTDH